jgi:hypothetical protein
LVVVGVHAPEFSFEKNIDNVRRAVKETRVDYPIALDNDHAIWRDFNNEYWPALYFVDAQGRIRHHQFGEGENEQSELILQQLLTEAGSRNVSHELVSVSPQGAEVGADWNDLRSAENYVSYERTQNFASPGGARPDKRYDYTLPRDWASITGLSRVVGRWGGKSSYSARLTGALCTAFTAAIFIS